MGEGRATPTSRSCSTFRSPRSANGPGLRWPSSPASDPDRNVGLTDYLLGQADPIGRADAARHLREDPADHGLASGLASSLQMLVPNAELPKLPPEPGGGRFMRRSEPAAAAPAASPSPAPAAPRRERSGPPISERLGALTSSQSRTIALLGGGGLILLVVVLASPASSAVATTRRRALRRRPHDLDHGRGTGEEIQEVPLVAAKGSDATGTATFGIAKGDQAYVDWTSPSWSRSPRARPM